MKIVFSDYDDLKNPFYGGGGAKAIHEVAKRLAARHEVTVITGKYPGSRDETIDGVRYHRIGSNGKMPRVAQVIFQFSLIKEMRKHDFDVWVENTTPPFSTIGLQLFTKKPVVFLAMNMSGRDMYAKYHVPFYLVENLGLKTYHHAIGMSETMRRLMLSANPRLRIAVIPNGVEQSLIDEPEPKESDGQYILALGRIDIQHKGLDMLLDAYHKIARETNVPLVFAGSGLTKDEIWVRNRIKALNLSDRVRYLGKVTGDAKAETFRKGLFLAAPSRCEGVPLVIMEACCYGLPPVIFGIEDLAWLPETHCVRVPPFNIDAYAAALLDLLRNSEKRFQMGRTVKSWIRDFSWDSIAKRYEDFLISAVGRNEVEPAVQTHR